MGDVLGALLEGHVQEAFAAGGPFNSAAHPRGAKGSGKGGKFIASGASGPAVKQVQGKVGAKQDGQFGAQTKAQVEAYQRKNGLQVDGVVGAQTAAALLGSKNAKSVKVGALSAAQATQLGVSGKASASKAKSGGRKSKSSRAKGKSPRRQVTGVGARTGGGVGVG